MNPRVKKIARNILFLLSIPMIIAAFVFAQSSTQKNVCKALHINIENNDLSFVTQKDIIDIVEKEGINPKNSFINAIDLGQLESALNENKWISESNAFIGADHSLNITINQKRPVIRIVEKDSSDYSYFLDTYANPIPVSNQYSPRLPVATTMNLTYTKKDLEIKSDLVALSNFIQQDSFWNAAISQINLRDDYQLELIPEIGNQVIILGNVDDLEDKLKRMFSFYKQGLHTVNWDLYDEFDLRFKGQIVCRNKRGDILSENPYDDKSKKLMATNLANAEKKVVTTPSIKQVVKSASVPIVKKPLVAKATAKQVEKSEPKKVTKEKKIETSKPKKIENNSTKKPQ